MIGRKVLTVEGEAYPLCLSTKAMVRLEELHGGKSITDILAAIQGNPGITFFAQFFSVVMNDGHGADLDDAMAFMDRAGGVFAVASVVGEIVQAAFPEEAHAPAGGGKAKAGKAMSGKTKAVRKA